MAKKRIIELTEKSAFESLDAVIVDNSASGTFKITAPLDNTLTKSGKAADAKSVGDRFTPVENGISEANSHYDSLDAQFQQFIAPTGTSPNPAEVENARVGADNVTYSTLGDAIRTQATHLKTDVDNSKNALIGVLYEDTISFPFAFEEGSYYEGDFVPSNTGKIWCIKHYIDTTMIDNIELKSQYRLVLSYFNGKSAADYVRDEDWNQPNDSVPILKQYPYVTVTIHNINWDVIDQNDICENLIISRTKMNVEIREAIEANNTPINESFVQVDKEVKELRRNSNDLLSANDNYKIFLNLVPGNINELGELVPRENYYALYISDKITVRDKTKLIVQSGYHAYIHKYSSDGYVGYEDYNEGTYDIFYNGKVRIGINKTDFSDITAEMASLNVSVCVKNPIAFPSDFTNEYIHLPKLHLIGDVTDMSKENSKIMEFEYIGAKDYANSPREGETYYGGYAKVKWQGSSSLAYSKKNYTITLYSNSECTSAYNLAFREAWGAHNKYCLKANVVDASHGRNIVCAKMWGELVKSRTANSFSKDWFEHLPNGGAIDGYPIRLYINGEYSGLYTLNIPKDKWMFGLTGTENECIISADEHSQPTKFWEPFDLDDTTNWKIELEPSDTAWIENSFNKIYEALQISSTSSKKAALEAVVDIENIIDYGIFINLLCARDNEDKNMLYVTKDKNKWVLSAYDLDTTLGNNWHGCSYFSPNDETSLWYGNRLIRDVCQLYREELKSRYSYVRANIINQGNIACLYTNFAVDIPLALKSYENLLYSDIPGTLTSDLAQMMAFMQERTKILDAYIDSL